MKNQIDWRHIVAAAVVVAMIVLGGSRLLTAGPEPPKAVAPAGPNSQLQDAPEHPMANGAAAVTPR